MQLDRVIIRHACEIIADQSGLSLRRGLLGVAAPEVWQSLWLGHEQGKELIEDPFGLRAHTINFVMLVHARIQKRALRPRVPGELG